MTETELLGEELVLAYGDEPVVDGESVVFPRGRVTALVGPNGSGKSTLLKGLADQLAPDKGVVRLDGRDIHAFRVDARVDHADGAPRVTPRRPLHDSDRPADSE